MSQIKPQTVEFMIVSADDALADAFVLGLDALDTVNPVQRFQDYQKGVTYLDSFGDQGISEVPPIVILDMREMGGEGLRFLNEVHRRRPYAEPIVFVVTEDDSSDSEENTLLEPHRRFVAGRLPPEEPAKAFIDQVRRNLSDNWNFEKTRGA